MTRPRCLDLFCSAGGSAMGLYRAGFDVTGIDIKPQPHYPSFHNAEYASHFEFHLADALAFPLEGYDCYWASPPCQRYSRETPKEYRGNHPDLIAATRELLMGTGKPYIIENVPDARTKLISPIMLCGSMFGLRVWRHRWFEVYPESFNLSVCCNHSSHPVLVTGTPKRNGHRIKEPNTAEIRQALQIDWMTKVEMDQAIPPAYAEFLGKQMMQYIVATKGAA